MLFMYCPHIKNYYNIKVVHIKLVKNTKIKIVKRWEDYSLSNSSKRSFQVSKVSFAASSVSTSIAYPEWIKT